MNKNWPQRDKGEARRGVSGRNIAVAIVVVVAIGGGLFWGVRSYFEMWRHIMPSTHSGASTSMAPYDVVLRVASKGGVPLDESTPPMEWILRLPRAYVTRELGDNGVTYRRFIEGGDNYFVDFQINVSADGQTFIPTAGRKREDQKVRSMIFHLRNVEAIPSIRSFESCIPQHLQNTILEPRGDKTWDNEECIDRDLRCRIRMQVDGWKVDLAVTKDLYSSPENACRLARKFLDSYTVKRDDVR
jgi:hypothetical protein